jgi:hypothetical protein
MVEVLQGSCIVSRRTNRESWDDVYVCLSTERIVVQCEPRKTPMDSRAAIMTGNPARKSG